MRLPLYAIKNKFFLRYTAHNPERATEPLTDLSNITRSVTLPLIGVLRGGEMHWIKPRLTIRANLLVVFLFSFFADLFMPGRCFVLDAGGRF